MGKSIKAIVIHCSDSTWGNVLEIDDWHKARGWKGIGYLGVIGNGLPIYGMKTPWPFADGAWAWGRPLDDSPYLDPFEYEAHVKGWNGKSVGFCMIGKPVGKDNTCEFTEAQLMKAREVALYLINRFELTVDDIYGHYELDSGKTCPGMDMDRFRSYLREPIAVSEVLKKNSKNRRDEMNKREELFKKQIEELQQETKESLEELRLAIDNELMELANKAMPFIEGWSYGITFGRKGKQLTIDNVKGDPKIALAGYRSGRMSRDIIFPYIQSQLGQYGGIAMMVLKFLGIDIETEEE